MNATNHNLHVYLYPDGHLLLSEYPSRHYAGVRTVHREILRGSEAEIEE